MLLDLWGLLVQDEAEPPAPPPPPRRRKVRSGHRVAAGSVSAWCTARPPVVVARQVAARVAGTAGAAASPHPAVLTVAAPIALTAPAAPVGSAADDLDLLLILAVEDPALLVLVDA